MEESIVFRGDVDDRSLDKSAKKIDKRLEKSGDITPRFNERELQRSLPDSISVGVEGGGSGGGMSKFELASLSVSERTLKYQKLSANEDTERNRILERWGRTLEDIRNRIPALAGEQRPALAGETIDMGTGGFGSGAAAGAGGGRIAGAVSGLASKIPASVGSVVGAAAIPVALGGAGLLAIKGLHDMWAKASPKLQQMDTIFATALQNFQAPFGNAMAEALEPSATSLLEASMNFRQKASEEGFGPAFQGLAEDFFAPRINELLTREPMENPLSDTIDDIRAGGEFGAVAGGMFGGKLGGQIGGALGSVMAGIWSSSPIGQGLQTLGGILDSIDAKSIWDWIKTGSKDVWGDLITGWQKAKGLWDDFISWSDKTLWNDLIEWSSKDAWGDLIEWSSKGVWGTLITWTTKSVWGDILFGTEKSIWEFVEGGSVGLEMGLDVSVLGQELVDADLFSVRTNFQRGGVVQGRTTATIGEAGPEVVQPLSEFEQLAERIARTAADVGGGGADMGNVERKLDRLHRDLQNLSRAMSDMAIQVDGETLGTATNDARRDRVSDTNPLA